jgi:hypothetical protein
VTGNATAAPGQRFGWLEAAATTFVVTAPDLRLGPAAVAVVLGLKT